MQSIHPKYNSIWVEVLLRVILFALFVLMEHCKPFERYISREQLLTEYHHPSSTSYVPSRTLWTVVLVVPMSIFTLGYYLKKDCYNFQQSILAFTLALGLNGLITDTAKLLSGRPRPDFFWRCFPDGVITDDLHCTGNETTISDGRKSFPSGHSSFSFCALGLSSLYLQGAWGIWSRSRGHGVALLVSLAPLHLALAIAISRTCDYHHHWQDVLTGSVLGFGVAYMCYRQYYYPLTCSLSGVPYPPVSTQPGVPSASSKTPTVSDNTPLLDKKNGQIPKLETKWI